MDPYKIFKLPKNFTIKQLKERYKKLAMKYHPDKSQTHHEDGSMFKHIQAAYKKLLREYEKTLHDKDFITLKNDYRRNVDDIQTTPPSTQKTSTMHIKQFDLETFNKNFEKYRFHEDDGGYDHWMKKSSLSQEQPHNQPSHDQLYEKMRGQFNHNEFNKKFEKNINKTVSTSSLTSSKASLPSAIIGSLNPKKSLVYAELGVSKLRDYSGDNLTNKKLQYTDYKVAHTTSHLVHPKELESFDNKEMDIETTKMQRKNPQYLMNDKEMIAYQRHLLAEKKKEDERLKKLEDYNKRISKHFQKVSHLLMPKNH